MNRDRVADCIRVTVRDLGEAEAALRAAAARGERVILESPPGAALYWGAPYFLALVKAAREAAPGIDCDAVLDCGEAPGVAIEALRQGVKAVRLGGDLRAIAAVRDIAEQLGARVETAPRPGPAARA